MIDLTDLGAAWAPEGRVAARLPGATLDAARAFAAAHAPRWAARLAPVAVPAGPPEVALRGDHAVVEQPYRLLPARVAVDLDAATGVLRVTAPAGATVAFAAPASESVAPTSPAGDDAAPTLPPASKPRWPP